ncbi:hypothetical protein CTAYLR_003189 [Chrysophaeum taylorii]|uniref:Peptidase S54 rhomboid domain-containing protein n=1 Tax=Chrysophaeum taylorii TaxID=2483200 RepID=A0AAD7XKI1_9STRA|nr:hypothetical protein CTAYLR_003189 [Chrysophaeum taylorii]
MFVSCAEGVVVVQKRIAPSCATWLPRSKAPKRRLRHWPEARPLWVGYGAVSSVVFGLTIASAIKYALPGVVEYTRKSISPWSVGANALVGRCVSVRAYTVTASALISAGARKRIGKGIELSTQAPLLSDFALDAGRHPKQHYRLLTYWLFHANLPHVLFDAFFLRYALSTRSNARTRDDLPVCGRSILPLALVGVYAGGLAHRCFGGKSRALGLAGANAALLGAALAADVKLQQASEAWPVFARVMVLGMGTLIFGSSGLPVGAGFLSGFLFGEATGPQVVVKEDTAPSPRKSRAPFPSENLLLNPASP